MRVRVVNLGERPVHWEWWLIKVINFSYAWSLPVTWQRWRSHDSIRHSQKPHATCKPHGSMFCRSGVKADRSFTLREYRFSTFFVPVTLTLTQWPSYTNLTRIPGDILDVQTWTSYVKAFESYRLTYIHTHIQTDIHDRNYIPRRFVGDQ